MERQVNADMGIVGAEHVKGVSEIKDFLIAVPAPVCVRIGEMPVTGAVENAVFAAIADFMSMRGCVGMDAGAVAGNGNTVCGDEAVFKGRDEGGKSENLLKPFFIMERKNRMLQGVNLFIQQSEDKSNQKQYRQHGGQDIFKRLPCLL